MLLVRPAPYKLFLKISSFPSQCFFLGFARRSALPAERSLFHAACFPAVCYRRKEFPYWDEVPVIRLFFSFPAVLLCFLLVTRFPSRRSTPKHHLCLKPFHEAFYVPVLLYRHAPPPPFLLAGRSAAMLNAGPVFPAARPVVVKALLPSPSLPLLPHSDPPLSSQAFGTPAPLARPQNKWPKPSSFSDVKRDFFPLFW